jgi:hypothetical protein
VAWPTEARTVKVAGEDGALSVTDAEPSESDWTWLSSKNASPKSPASENRTS